MTHQELAQLIVVKVTPHYIDSQSDPDDERFVFSYTVSIENRSTSEVQLLSRSWLITDANGKKVSVQGEGVVGQKPKIAASASFEYSSGAVIKTPVGTMEGFYQMMSPQGELFQVAIPVFSLNVPNILH